MKCNDQNSTVFFFFFQADNERHWLGIPVRDRTIPITRELFADNPRIPCISDVIAQSLWPETWTMRPSDGCADSMDSSPSVSPSLPELLPMSAMDPYRGAGFMHAAAAAAEDQGVDDYGNDGNDYSDAGNDYSNTSNNYSDASNDYSKDGNDYSDAGNDYSDAGNDYSDASNDYSKDGNDYSDAGNDYSDAGNDYSNDGNDYSDAGNDYSDDEGDDEGADDYNDEENGDSDADQVQQHGDCCRVLGQEAARLLESNAGGSDSDESSDNSSLASQSGNLTSSVYNDCTSNSDNLEDESEDSYLTQSENSGDLDDDQIDQPQVNEIPRNNDFVIRIESSSSSSDEDDDDDNESADQGIKEEQPELKSQRYKIF